MARQTRAQRRARREQQDGGQAALERAPARPQQQLRPAAPPPAPAQAAARRGPGAGLRGFVSESWAELNKVEWPGRPQLIQGTVVVLLACIVVGLYLWGADLVFKHLVQQVFLR